MSESDGIGKLVVVKDQVQPEKKLRELKAPALQRGVATKLPAASMAELLQRKPGALLNYKDAVALVTGQGFTLKHHLTPGESFVLSPRRNYVEGHGYLNFTNVSHVYGENDQAWFMRHDGQPDDYRKLDIWLTGLTAGASYLIQIRVTGESQGTWQVRGSDTGGVVTTVNGGYMLTIPVLVHDIRYTMSLVSVEARNMGSWGFYDATVMAL